jgi:hypothetical protein
VTPEQAIVIVVAFLVLRWSYTVTRDGVCAAPSARRTKRVQIGGLATNRFRSAEGAAQGRQLTQRLPLGWAPTSPVIEVLPSGRVVTRRMEVEAYDPQIGAAS